MTRLISAVMVVALLVSVTPVLAGDVFQAFSRLSPAEQTALTPLPDDQLAAIRGGQFHIPSDLVVDSCPHMLRAAQPLISR